MTKKIIFDKKISVVLGGAGFIGSNLCEELLKTSKVICIDNFSTGDEKNIDHLLAEPDFEFINYDLCEPIHLDNLPELQKFKIKFQGVQEIFNLACPMSVNNFSNNKIRILLANSLLVKNALDMAIYYDAKLLHFSSSAVYGPRTEEKFKFKESDLTNLDFISMRSAFDEGKRYAESLVMNYQRETGVNAKIVRLFNVFGPRMTLSDGQIIPDFINNALDNTDIIINGTETSSCSFCYISDCIDACIKIINSDYKEPVNIGSDVDVKLSQIAEKIISILESKSQIKYDAPKEYLTPFTLPDISIARDKLAWLPVVPLEKGIRETVHHLRANKGLKNVKNAVVDFIKTDESND